MGCGASHQTDVVAGREAVAVGTPDEQDGQAHALSCTISNEWESLRASAEGHEGQRRHYEDSAREETVFVPQQLEGARDDSQSVQLDQTESLRWLAEDDRTNLALQASLQEHEQRNPELARQLSQEQTELAIALSLSQQSCEKEMRESLAMQEHYKEHQRLQQALDESALDAFVQEADRREFPEDVDGPLQPDEWLIQPEEVPTTQ